MVVIHRNASISVQNYGMRIIARWIDSVSYVIRFMTANAKALH